MTTLSKTVVLDVVGLSASLISETHTPFLQERYLQGHREINPAFPALTCVAQANYLTGKPPSEHGICANGFYDKSTKEVRNWHQSRSLVQSRRIYDAIKELDSSAVTFSNCAWHCMHDDALDVVITPRPQYMSDGRKRPDIWTKPANLRDELQGILGQFPMHRFWGPMSGIQSSKWIAEASKIVDNEFDPVFSFIYLPHLDYVLQKRGPADTEGSVIKELGLIDEVVKDLVGFYEARGAKVVILSEYGIGNVNEPVHINRVLNQAGYITTRTERDGLTLDCGSSRAFAIADHQIAMVHVARDADREPLKKLLQQVSGIEHVFGKADAPVWAAGSFHPERAGDLLCIAKRSAWFTYYFWLHDNDAPDYAGTVAIHDKPGYDPCELLLAYPSWTGEWFGYFNLFARAILSQICRLRVLISATPYHEQACLSIRGSHGRIDEAIAPIVIFPSLTSKEGIVDSCDIFNILLKTVSSENNLDSTAA